MKYSLGLVAIVAARLHAQEPPPIAKYVPPSPDPHHVFVLDSAHILSASAIAALQDSSQQLQRETSGDIAWVTLPTLGGRAIEDATVYLGRVWKVGSAGAPGDPLRNRGLVILYIPDKSKTAGSNFRIEVGKGLQGTITDSRSRQISAAMRDDLRGKHFDAGYMKGWTVAAALVREDFASQQKPGTQQPVSDPTAPETPSAYRTNPQVIFFVAAFVVLVFVFLWATIRALLRYRRSSGGSRPRRRRSSSWSSSGVVATDFSSDSGSNDSSSSDSGGGDFGGGGGFDGGGSSDSI